MKYLNNWVYPLSDMLPSGVTDLPLPAGALEAIGLADTEQAMLTIISADAELQRVFEFVRIENDGGDLIISRGQYDTDDREWPAGSRIYSALPAEQINEWIAQIANLLARVTELESGGPGGSGITVGTTPSEAPLTEGQGILAGDKLFIGRNTADVNGWTVFEAMAANAETETSSFLTLFNEPSIQRARWAPDAGYIELSIAGWLDGGDVDSAIILEYPGTDALVIAGSTAGTRIVANVTLTDRLDGTASIVVGPLQLLRISRRAATQTVIITVEPLESLTL